VTGTDDDDVVVKGRRKKRSSSPRVYGFAEEPYKHPSEGVGRAFRPYHRRRTAVVVGNLAPSRPQ
jgi:hypothetical protein